jgi:GT2 family glycosyltransferase
MWRSFDMERGSLHFDLMQESRPLAAGAEVSVIIPSYRSAHTLEQCLAAATRQRTRRPYQVVVVHSGEEPIRADLPRRFTDVRFFRRSERIWPGSARNWAARRVDSPWLLFLDADCVADEDWLERLVRTAEERGVCGVGGSVENGSPRSACAWVMHQLEFGEWTPAARIGATRDFPSCNALYRRSAFLAAGGFPEDLFPGEDTVLNCTIARAGGALLLDLNGRVRHIHRCGPREMLRHQYQLGASYAHACTRYGLRENRLTDWPRWLRVPVVCSARLVLAARRLDARQIVRFVCLAPLVVASLFAWSLGLVQAERG